MNFERTRTNSGEWQRKPLRLSEGWKGALVGGALGSLLGPAGTAAGAALGHGIGNTLGGAGKVVKKAAGVKDDKPGFFHNVARGALGLKDAHKDGSIGHKLGSMWAQHRADAKAKAAEKKASASAAPAPGAAPAKGTHLSGAPIDPAKRQALLAGNKPSPAADKPDQTVELQKARLHAKAQGVKAGNAPAASAQKTADIAATDKVKADLAKQADVGRARQLGRVEKLKALSKGAAPATSKTSSSISPELSAQMSKIGIDAPASTPVKGASPSAAQAPAQAKSLSNVGVSQGSGSKTSTGRVFDAIREKKYRSMGLTPEQERKARERAVAPAGAGISTTKTLTPGVK